MLFYVSVHICIWYRKPVEQNVDGTDVTYMAKKTLENELQNKTEKKKAKNVFVYIYYWNWD